MKEYSFYDIYDNCLEQVSTKLDSYLSGLWKEIDYLRAGSRTQITRFENELRVFFGDRFSKNRYKFSLAYEIVDTNKLKITDILYFSSGGAYSDKVIELKGIVLKGKTEKELLESELKQLQEIKEQQEDNLRALEEHTHIKKTELKGTNQQILDIKNRIDAIEEV